MCPAPKCASPTERGDRNAPESIGEGDLSGGIGKRIPTPRPKPPPACCKHFQRAHAVLPPFVFANKALSSCPSCLPQDSCGSEYDDPHQATTGRGGSQVIRAIYTYLSFALLHTSNENVVGFLCKTRFPLRFFTPSRSPPPSTFRVTIVPFVSYLNFSANTRAGGAWGGITPPKFKLQKDPNRQRLLWTLKEKSRKC